MSGIKKQIIRHSNLYVKIQNSGSDSFVVFMEMKLKQQHENEVQENRCLDSYYQVYRGTKAEYSNSWLPKK